MQNTRLKIGLILMALIMATAYILDDIFYYSDMKLAEIFVFPIAMFLLLMVTLLIIIPSIKK